MGQIHSTGARQIEEILVHTRSRHIFLQLNWQYSTTTTNHYLTINTNECFQDRKSQADF